MIVVLIIVAILYVSSILWILKGMQKLPYFETTDLIPKTSFSIVIPFRNEEKNLPLFIDSLLKINYPNEHFEVLFVNDASEDNSVKIIENKLNHSVISYTVLDNIRYSNSPKKDAISLSVKMAIHPWIITTDADCQVPKDWLELLDAFIQNKEPKMVCMPVVFEKDASLVKQFQFFDGLSLQAVTMGGFGNNKALLCNGANLAYKKKVFFEVAGYVENNHITSGDDIFLMEKFREVYPQKIAYLKNASATVNTQSVSGWDNLFHQRIRWASKTKHQNNNIVKVLGGITVLTNMAFIFCVIGFFVFPLQAIIFLSFIFFKIVLDAITVKKAARFFKHKFSFIYLIICSIFYPFIFVWVLGNSLLGTYQWKGRSFKK